MHFEKKRPLCPVSLLFRIRRLPRLLSPDAPTRCAGSIGCRAIYPQTRRPAVWVPSAAAPSIPRRADPLCGFHWLPRLLSPVAPTRCAGSIGCRAFYPQSRRRWLGGLGVFLFKKQRYRHPQIRPKRQPRKLQLMVSGANQGTFVFDSNQHTNCGACVRSLGNIRRQPLDPGTARSAAASGPRLSLEGR